MQFEIEAISVFGNPNVGVYIFANDDFAIVPPGLKEQTLKKIERALRVRIVEAKVADSTLIGLFVSGNNHAVIVPSIIKEYELEKLKKEVDLPVKVVHSKLTAMGNIILCNDKFALLHPDMKRWLEEVSKTLGVPAETGTIAHVPTVGSVAVINDKGGIVHPDASDEELDELEKKFQVRLDVGTVNYGVPYVKTGLVANNKGAVVGELTTGVEMARIVQALSGE
jgi:translation initiation factor 6